MVYFNPEAANWTVTQAFGALPNNGINPPGGHTGRDKGMPPGQPLRAPANGIIRFEGVFGTDDGSDNPWLCTRGGGIMVVLETEDGKFIFTYGHMSSTIVNKDQRVVAGQIVGYSGNTGFSTGAHHHFGVLPDGWNVRNGTYGYINPDIVCKGFWGDLAPAGGVSLAPNQRRVAATVNALQRSQPEVRVDNVVRTIPAGQLEVFEGYVRGQAITIPGEAGVRNDFTSDIWYQDKIGFVWAGSFDDPSTAGLPDLTARRSLEANQRYIPETTVQRKEPSASAPIVRTIQGGTVEVFTGYVHGETLTRPGEAGKRFDITSDIWFVDAKGYMWAGDSWNPGVVGLADLTVITPPAPPTAPVDVPFAYLRGMDVSIYQEKAALNTLEGDFVWIKASEGGDNWDDDALASNVAEARLGNKRIGFYHFARPLLTPGNTAAEEARSFLFVIAPYLRKGDLVILDWEAENQHRTDWAKQWLDIVAKETGATPLIYLNGSAIRGTEEHPNPDWSAVEAKYPLWFAGGPLYHVVTDGYKVRPVSECGVEWKSGVVAWQYSAMGRLRGYDGDLDINTFYGTLADMDKLGATKLLQEVPENPPIFEPPAGISKADADRIVDAYNDWLRERFLKEQGE
jgi:GH25 family lysozyme M1 (1,4-beta-N-acetylmuramidase)